MKTPHRKLIALAVLSALASSASAIELTLDNLNVNGSDLYYIHSTSSEVNVIHLDYQPPCSIRKAIRIKHLQQSMQKVMLFFKMISILASKPMVLAKLSDSAQIHPPLLLTLYGLKSMRQTAMLSL